MPLASSLAPKIKLSLNAYSFDAALRLRMREPNAGMDLLELLEFCADRDFEAIDATGYYFPGYPSVPCDAFLKEFKRRAFALGIAISGTGVKNNFTDPDPAVRAEDVRRVIAWIEVAARIGAPVLRVFAGKVPPAPHTWAQGADWVTECLRECLPHAERHGVILGLQNHGDLLNNADQCLEILGRFQSPWLGLVLDTGHFHTADPYADIARMIPFTVNWQIKERTHGNGPAGGATDLPRLVSLIRAAGWRGYVPIETLPRDGFPYDPEVAVDALLGGLRTALQKA
jgi:sugar phosphate isomerase/epimerase